MEKLAKGVGWTKDGTQDDERNIENGNNHT